jgi:hypothetical protein
VDPVYAPRGEWAINRGSMWIQCMPLMVSGLLTEAVLWIQRLPLMVSGLFIEAVLWIQCMAW